MKKVFAICDEEKEYAGRLSTYINHGCSLPFEIQAFTDPGELAAYGKTHPIEILLVSEKSVTDEMKDIRVGQTILLRDGIEMQRDGGTKEPGVYKYQAAGEVVREVMDLYSAEREAADAPSVGKGRIRKIGVISPADPGLKTVFAILTGQILSERNASLYCNLEPYSGLPGMLGEKERTLSDLLYFFRQGKGGLIYSLNGMTERIQGLDLIPAVQNPEDLLEMSGEEWVGFFTEILRTGVYENLILDIGCGIRDLDEVLAFCDVVYLPQGREKMARAADAVFLRWLSDTGFPSEKIRCVQMEAAPSGGEGRAWFEGMLHGKDGQMIRNLVYADMGTGRYETHSSVTVKKESRGRGNAEYDGNEGYASASYGEAGGQRRTG